MRKSIRKVLLFDAQTSGGLLITLPADQVEAFGQEMAQRDAPWWQIGEVVEREGASIVVMD
jgi:selenide,water dikinase